MGDIVSQVRQILSDADMHAVNAFPKYRLPQLLSPMIAVGQAEITSLPCAFSAFLGLCSDQPVFGSEIEFIIQLDVYSPQRSGGNLCAEAARSALTAVSTGLSSCTLKSIQVSPVRYDENIDFFRSSLRLTFGTLLYQSES